MERKAPVSLGGGWGLKRRGETGHTDTGFSDSLGLLWRKLIQPVNRTTAAEKKICGMKADREEIQGVRVNLPVWMSEPVGFGLSQSLRPG